DLKRRREEAAEQRACLDARHAHLAERATIWDAEREALLAELRGREQRVDQRSEALAQLRRRWVERWRAARDFLKAELERCRDLRQHYAVARAACHEQCTALERQQRGLAERALALEQYQLEVLGRAKSSAAAERRLERLRRRCTAAT